MPPITLDCNIGDKRIFSMAISRSVGVAEPGELTPYNVTFKAPEFRDGRTVRCSAMSDYDRGVLGCIEAAMNELRRRHKLLSEPFFKPPNHARCLKCGDVIRSRHVHDFVSCKCGAIALDGGYDYCRRIGDYWLFGDPNQPWDPTDPLPKANEPRVVQMLRTAKAKKVKHVRAAVR